MNPNADYPVCIENPSVPICQRYIISDNGIEVNNLEDYVKKYLSTSGTKEETPSKRVKNDNFFKDNIKYIIIGVVILVVGGSVYLIIDKRRRKL